MFRFEINIASYIIFKIQQQINIASYIIFTIQQQINIASYIIFTIQQQTSFALITLKYNTILCCYLHHNSSY